MIPKPDCAAELLGNSGENWGFESKLPLPCLVGAGSKIIYMPEEKGMKLFTYFWDIKPRLSNLKDTFLLGSSSNF